MDRAVKTAGVIFDMDGCLVDTESIYKVAWRRAFAKYAVDVSTDQIESWLGLGWDIIEKEIDQLTKSNELTTVIRAAREDLFFKMLAEGLVQFMPGALEILEYAKKEGLNIGLASSTYQEKGLRILKHFELLKYFDYLAFGDEVAHRKPAGDIYLRAIEKSGLKKAELLVFEDSLVGCQAANEAGLQTIWIPENIADSLKADYPAMVLEVVPSLVKGKIILENRR